MSIFECKDAMPPKDNSPDVVRVALTRPEMQANLTPALGYSFPSGPTRDVMHVANVDRPRFGHKV